MRIRNRTTYMNKMPEGVPKRSFGSRLVKWIYLLLILSILLYLVFLAVERFTTISSRGFVEVDKISISSSRGGLITDVPLSVGQKIAKGDVLVTLEPVKSCSEQFDSRGDDLVFQITLNKNQLESLQGELEVIKNQRVDEGIRRALEVDRDYLSQNKRLKKEASNLMLKIAKMKQEIRVKQRQLNAHRQYLATVVPDSLCQAETIVSPVSGHVLLIRKYRHEMVERGESIVRLVPDTAAVYIDAILDSDVMRYVAPGMVLEVEFPDGTTSRGIAESIQSAASENVASDLSGYSANPGRIIARLIPANHVGRQLWMNYTRMEVRIKGSKL